MAVKIRLKRVGAKNKPAFRIVVADGRSPRDGKFIEELGTYLQAWNMAAAPSIILMIAIALAIVRRYKAKKWAARRN